ncbi:hypothetical protein L810_0924 [Burkholderia sp. AU4i]|nr:hypothetical protein L810_0924 [Burkholderia sp. AU4i]
MQHGRHRRDHEQCRDERRAHMAARYRTDHQRADHADADEREHAADPEQHRQHDLARPRPHEPQQRPQRFRPADLRRIVVQRPHLRAGRRTRGRAGRRRHAGRFGDRLQLRPHQAAIRAVTRDQRRVRALVDHLPLVEHQDAVGADHAGQPVREHERGPPAREPVECLLDQRFVLRVDRRQRLVEQQDRCVAQQRAGNREALALAARQHEPAFADARRITVRQRRDEIVRVGRTRGGDHVRVARVGAAEPQVVGDAAVEQRRILRDDRDHLAHLAGIERPHVAAADADRAALRIVLAQQQAHDGRFARAARPDDGDRLAFANREAQRRMRVGATPRIREADGVECDLRPQALHARRIGGRRVAPRIEQRVDRIRRRLADHPLMQYRTQVAQRPEDLAAGHQHDQQRLEAHVAVPHAPRADRDRGGRAEAGAEIGEEPRQQAEREHPERAVGQRARLRGQLRAERRALPECLQRRQALHRVEKLLAERLERGRARERRALVGTMHELRQRQRDERRDQQDGGRRHVPPREHREDHHRRAGGDHELRQVGAEKGLQLLDAVDDGQHHAARAFTAEPCGAERRDPVEQPRAQRGLHAPGRVLREHRAAMVEPRAQQHAGRRCNDGFADAARRRAGKDQRQHAAEEHEAQDPDTHREQSERDGRGDPPAQSRHHCP